MTIPHRPATEREIEEAHYFFWSAIASKFPETDTGDSQCTGQDEAALAFWANNDSGNRARGMIGADLPSQIKIERLNDAVEAGMAAAKRVLPGVIDSNRDIVFKELSDCVRDWIRWNIPDVADTPTISADAGWFEVHVYETQDEWDACKGAGSVEPNIETFDDAVGIAESDEYADAFEVTVKAAGEHENYEPGEVVYSRNDRRAPGSAPRP